MKISSISNTNSFGRVIQLINASNPESTRSNAKELVRVLNNSDSNVYSQNQTGKVRNFFVDILGDYNGYNQIMTRKLSDGRNVLISGEDAKDLKYMELELHEQRDRVQKNSRKRQYFTELFRKAFDKEINERLENGKKGKPNTIIKFYTDNKNKSQINKIDYEFYKETCSKNGEKSIFEEEQTFSKSYPVKVFRTVEYDNKTLNLQA